ncbi:MAG: Rod shape-determining protein mreB [candidate division WS6 bacterium GW2011_GWC1_36_11]|uniref:Cell shape-determining protein MreB n=2 Tax=Candidatus Dojkabacteria TaxID=74243 RepID=A0A0G0DUU5_9BACT|nr:MAG: Rod shape-determining protein mreB [candidate division WS6 bacterium GW2011_GWC1_36_11]KKQ04613.1 MAG: Rod shape-determining protein mreB [candidate division WS6 bacterium GW2011_WS6_36_26]KKQ11000.1 MAG: Rod shape-determining protein mreB [candidate division WS6 bacterium GW2011_GWE1_36_69]KKQ17858.1 MAG: Rod shape-determining protein mreB [candidate division WS6 bacterium GW2011_GWF1_36_8]MBU1119675.1 rod shape-determining protein [Patescibacteria group bacterium]
MFVKKLGIDLGTANSVVFVQGEGIVLTEPTVVAIDVNNFTVIAVGLEAKEMIGKTPDNIVAKRPLRNGVIADSRVTEALLRYFFDKALGKSRFFKPDVVISVPAGITSVEERAVLKAANAVGARNVTLLPEPLLAALGAEMPIQTSSGNMIINMGGGTTEVAVISLDGVVEYESLRVAGDAINEAIISYMRKKKGLLIGEQTAEKIKIKIGSALEVKDPREMEVRGRDVGAGMPKSVVVNSNDIAKAVEWPLRSIIKSVQAVLEKTPPELSADIIDRGMVMSGGTAMLRNLDKLFSRATGVPAHVADDPLFCVVKGTGIALDLIEEGSRKFSFNRDFRR